MYPVQLFAPTPTPTQDVRGDTVLWYPVAWPCTFHCSSNHFRCSLIFCTASPSSSVLAPISPMPLGWRADLQPGSPAVATRTGDVSTMCFQVAIWISFLVFAKFLSGHRMFKLGLVGWLARLKSETTLGTFVDSSVFYFRAVLSLFKASSHFSALNMKLYTS